MDESEEILTRREQIGAKKKNKQEGQKGKNAKTKAAGKQAAGGRGNGRGRGGRGRGKAVLKRPARKPSPPKKEEEPAPEEGEEEEEAEIDPPVEEGALSASSSGAMEQPEGGKKRLRRSRPMDEAAAEDTSSPKAKAKANAKRKAKAKAEPRAPREPPVHTFEWEPELWDSVQKCLDECEACGEYDTKGKHSHREAVPYDDYVQFSVYWARSAVGVKVRQNLTDKWAQVAYFARETPCVFTNLLIANQWATQLIHVYSLQVVF